MTAQLPVANDNAIGVAAVLALVERWTIGGWTDEIQPALRPPGTLVLSIGAKRLVTPTTGPTTRPTTSTGPASSMHRDIAVAATEAVGAE